MKTKSCFVGMMMLVLVLACERVPYEESIPIATFDDIFLNLNLPEYQDLQVQKYMDIEADGASRGIILYKDGSSYRAFERTCTYLPFEAASIVEVNNAGLAMTDFSCGSVFGFDNGFPQAGPAANPLRQYRTILDGSFLTITDEIIN